MAWASTTLAAWETAALAGDGPLFVGTSPRDYANTPGNQRWNASGSGADADASAAAAPAWAAADVHGHALSGPATAGVNSWWIAEMLLPFAVVDTLAWVGLSQDAPGAVDHLVQVSTDAARTSGVLTLDSWTSSAERGSRILTSRYEADASGGWLFWRLSTASAWAPRVGELWAGRRRQIQAGPRRPWSLSSRVAGRSSTTVTQRVPWAGRWDADLELWVREAAQDDAATLRALRRDTIDLTRPMLMIPRPASAPQDVRIVRATNGLELDRAGPGETMARMQLVELPPYGVT
jgi:hypothetical protein